MCIRDSYYAALSEPDEKARAELMLLANLEIGFHEQTRLQPQIRDAMDAPIYEPQALRHRLLAELFPDPSAQLRLAAARLTGRAALLLAARDRDVYKRQGWGPIGTAASSTPPTTSSSSTRGPSSSSAMVRPMLMTSAPTKSASIAAH